MLKIDLEKLRFDYGKQMLVVGLVSLLIAGGAYAVDYALVGGEVVETKVVDAPSLALALAGEIMGFEAEAEGAQIQFEAYSVEVAQFNTFLSKHDFKAYPAVKDALLLARDEAEAKAIDAEGWLVYNQEQAVAKQTELDALNAVYTPTAIPKGA